MNIGRIGMSPRVETAAAGDALAPEDVVTAVVGALKTATDVALGVMNHGSLTVGVAAWAGLALIGTAAAAAGRACHQPALKLLAGVSQAAQVVHGTYTAIDGGFQGVAEKAGEIAMKDPSEIVDAGRSATMALTRTKEVIVRTANDEAAITTGTAHEALV